MSNARKIRILSASGRALFGPRWQSELSRKLGVSDRTVRRWVSGDSPVPAGALLSMSGMADEAASELTGLADVLRAAAEPPPA